VRGVGLTSHTPTPFRTLHSTCVLDQSRLDVSTAGRYCEKFELLKEAKDGIECDRPEDHVGAAQIFPLFSHPEWRTSTVKHHCPKTDIAACLRACSNNVGPDPTVVKKFSVWFRNTIIPLFTNALDQEQLLVKYSDWISGFPGSYKKKMDKVLDPEFWEDKKYTYEAFAKIEQQFTTVDHEHKNTPENSVKEMQICGPSDVKKLFANAFIKLLEGVAHRHIPQYCGRKNWPEICKTIEAKTSELFDAIFGAADGSGFDMTQLKWQHELMNELIMTCAKHQNVTFEEPLDVEQLFKVLQDSLMLDVTSGNAHYVTQGRASGDGWTTFGNTVLMMAYWMFTFDQAGIDDYFLLVKGDDVLMGLNQCDKAVFDKTWPLFFTSTKTLQDHGLGQICTKIQFGKIEELDFLSNHFFWTKHGTLRMSRIPPRVFQSTSWSTKIVPFVTHPNYHKYAQELVYSKGMCLLAWARGLPIWHVLGEKMVQLGKPGKLSEFNEYSDGVRTWHARDDYDSYLEYLENFYGITIADVKSIERKIASISCLSGVVDIPELDKFYG